MSMERVLLDGGSLTVGQVATVARDGGDVDLTREAWAKVAEGEALLRRMVAQGHPIYGVTTGFGALDGRPVAPTANRAQQQNLLRSHAASVSEPLPDDAVRAMMVIRANCLASGLTGVNAATLKALLAMLAAGVIPRVPRRGALGACGDLAPLAHMVLPLLGDGRARLRGETAWRPGAEVMAAAGIALPDISGRDGIALINGTEQTTAVGCLALADAERLVVAAEAVAALSMEALGAVNDSFDERVALAKPHPGQIATSAHLRALTKDSAAVLPPRPSRLRDALSLRCIPQVLGAVRDAVAHARQTLEIEINAVNDNPIFGLADGWVTSNSGNFHGQRAGEVLDFLATSLTSLAVISERRSARLVDEHGNGGLPAFLIHPAAAQGENSGFMLAQYTAAALVADLRCRSVPASIQSIPVCANTEDHVPLSPLAADRACFTVETAWNVVAIELLLAAQAMDLRGIAPAPALRGLHAALRARVPVMIRDRVMSDDIAAAEAVVRDFAPLENTETHSRGEAG